MLRVVRDMLKSLVYEILHAAIVLIAGLVGLMLFTGFVISGAILFLSGVIGASMCMSIAFYTPLWKFILLAVVGLVMTIGGLAAGTWFTEE